MEDAAGGVAFGQMDYLRGGTQWVQITAHRLNGSRTSPEQAKECLRLGRSRFPAAEILEEGPVTVAGIAGYQFVLRHSHASQTASQSTTQEVEPPLMVVQNVLCVPGTGEEPGTHYSMVLTSSGGDLENLRGILSRIAEGLEIPGVTNSPASAPTTKPAAEPMTAPASTEPGDP